MFPGGKFASDVATVARSGVSFPTISWLLPSKAPSQCNRKFFGGGGAILFFCVPLLLKHSTSSKPKKKIKRIIRHQMRSQAHKKCHQILHFVVLWKENGQQKISETVDANQSYATNWKLINQLVRRTKRANQVPTPLRISRTFDGLSEANNKRERRRASNLAAVTQNDGRS